MGIVLICLPGCEVKAPTETIDGTPWSGDWITLGQTLGVEEPGHGLTLRDSKVARSMYYTTWSIGEVQTYANSSDEEADVYDAQLVLLLMASDTTGEARMNVDEWLDMAADNYTVTSIAQHTYNGQEFTVLTYKFPSSTSLFAHGISAFAAFDTWAISAEFAYQETFKEDAGEILANFLTHCHYAVK